MKPTRKEVHHINKSTKYALCIGITLLTSILMVSGYKAMTILHQYKVDRAKYDTLSQAYAKPSLNEVPEITESNNDPRQGSNEYREALNERSPINVDFQLIRDEVNPETMGWIYCDDTPINYPVMYHQADNIYYLNHNSNGEDTACGAIYIDCSNFPDFRDTNTIIHGHHLNDGSMFGSLGQWSDQEYFDSHKVFYLNTPDSNYKVVMFAYFETPVGSSVYQIDFSGQEEISQWVKWLQNETLIKSDYEYMTGDHFIVLSTCMYSFENARGVLCGYVIPLKQ